MRFFLCSYAFHKTQHLCVGGCWCRPGFLRLHLSCCLIKMLSSIFFSQNIPFLIKYFTSVKDGDNALYTCSITVIFAKSTVLICCRSGLPRLQLSFCPSIMLTCSFSPQDMLFLIQNLSIALSLFPASDAVFYILGLLQGTTLRSRWRLKNCCWIISSKYHQGFHMFFILPQVKASAHPSKLLFNHNAPLYIFPQVLPFLIQ